MATSSHGKKATGLGTSCKEIPPLELNGVPVDYRLFVKRLSEGRFLVYLGGQFRDNFPGLDWSQRALQHLTHVLRALAVDEVLLREQLEKLEPFPVKVRLMLEAAGVARKLSRATGEGVETDTVWACVGDASHSVDFFTGSGLNYGFKQAIHLAKMVSGRRQQSGFEKELFCRWYNEVVNHDINRRIAERTREFQNPLNPDFLYLSEPAEAQSLREAELRIRHAYSPIILPNPHSATGGGAGTSNYFESRGRFQSPPAGRVLS